MVVGSLRKAYYNLCVSRVSSELPLTRSSLLVPRVSPLPTSHFLDPLHPTAEPRSWDTVNRRRLRVLAQCKAEKRKMGPAYLRELEGVVYRYANTLDSSSPHVSRDPASSCPPQSTPTSATMTASDPPSPPVALLVSESAFTRNCLHAAHASPLPFLLVHLPPSTSSTGAADAPGTVFGNPALVSARGVLGGEIEIRWERAGAPSSEALGNGRPGLWWQGRPLPSWTPDCRL